jgi:hypothetical protein
MHLSDRSPSHRFTLDVSRYELRGESPAALRITIVAL